MSNKIPDQGTVEVQATLNTQYLKEGEYTLFIPIPDEISVLIGKIAVQWGGFELRMDIVIRETLIRLHKKGPKNWERFPFKKRKKLFKNTLTDYTNQLFPTETKIFQEIADKSADLHWRRNTVVHGYINIHHKPDQNCETGFAPVFVAGGVHNGKSVEVNLDEPTLNKIWHDIAHLGGNLMAAVSRMGGRLETHTPEHVVADKDLLQDPQHGNFRFLATSNTPKPPSRSSRG